MGVRIREVFRAWLLDHANFLVAILYGDFWRLRDKCLSVKSGFPHILYFAYLESHCSWIGLKSKFRGGVYLPHGLRSIFISDHASIGDECTILQQVTIGSKNGGAPTIGSGVYIGAGAIIIGSITIGDGAKIGANAIVLKDVKPGAIVVSKASSEIERENR